jgi:D-xylose transport system permease protein
VAVKCPPSWARLSAKNGSAVIGGTSLLGGQGTVWGALLGGLVMASLDNGMSLMNTEAFWQPIIKGLMLVAAVAVDMAGRRSSR